jgi:hypothetical protein
MIDPTTRSVLQEAVRRESRSLLQYTREVPLWAAPVDRPALAKLKALAACEQAAVDDLGRYLEKHKAGLINLGPYPSQFTTVNDAAMRYLLPVLNREHQAAIKSLETDLANVSDADAKSRLADLIRLKQHHTAKLDALAKSG